MTNLEQPKNNKPSLLGTLIITILISGLFIVVVSFAIKAIFFQTSEPEVRKIVETVVEEKEVLLRAPKCERSFAEYEKLVKDGQSVLILADTKSYAVAGDLLSKRKIVRRSGELACGYLYARASKGNRPLDEVYDSIYISPQELGGHLIRPRSINLDKKQENKTEVLLPLSAIPYLPSVPYNPQAQNFDITDWVKLFNAAQKIKVDIGLSILSSAGLIEEVRVAYRCWNPETGKETNDCSLGVEE